MTAEEVIKELRKVIDFEYCGVQSHFAEDHDISPQYVHDVLIGRRPPGAKMLEALRLRKVVSYERLEE